MSEWQFHHLLDLSKLLAHSTNVIVANLIKSRLLFLYTRLQLIHTPAVIRHSLNTLVQDAPEHACTGKTETDHVTPHLAFNRLALTVDHRVGGNNTERCWVRLDDLELDSTHATPHLKDVTLVHGAVGFQEVGLEVHLKQVAVTRNKSYKFAETNAMQFCSYCKANVV